MSSSWPLIRIRQHHHRFRILLGHSSASTEFAAEPAPTPFLLFFFLFLCFFLSLLFSSFLFSVFVFSSSRAGFASAFLLLSPFYSSSTFLISSTLSLFSSRLPYLTLLFLRPAVGPCTESRLYRPWQRRCCNVAPPAMPCHASVSPLGLSRRPAAGCTTSWPCYWTVPQPHACARPHRLGLPWHALGCTVPL